MKVPGPESICQIAQDSVENRVVAIVSNVLSIRTDQITAETYLESELHASSLELIELQRDIEAEFGLSFSVDESNSVKNVGDIIKVIQNRQGKPVNCVSGGRKND